MAVHLIKTASEIELEVQRLAEFNAKVLGKQIVIGPPHVQRVDKATLYGSHWVIRRPQNSSAEFLDKAAETISRSWDIAPL